MFTMWIPAAKKVGERKVSLSVRKIASIGASNTRAMSPWRLSRFQIPRSVSIGELLTTNAALDLGLIAAIT